MQASLNDYVSRAYLNESSAAGAFVATEDRLSVAISGEKINLKNFWSGRWTSSWVIDLADDSQITISGDIKVDRRRFFGLLFCCVTWETYTLLRYFIIDPRTLLRGRQSAAADKQERCADNYRLSA